mmetsp:Transcript_13643/g.39855  ORF Transcript_13643/g.39855 Transcript_13643/m.39855 type:complete len:321 (+) Transcript_13643:252-1214(+)
MYAPNGLATAGAHTHRTKRREKGKFAGTEPARSSSTHSHSHASTKIGCTHAPKKDGAHRLLLARPIGLGEYVRLQKGAVRPLFSDRRFRRLLDAVIIRGAFLRPNFGRPPQQWVNVVVVLVAAEYVIGFVSGSRRLDHFVRHILNEFVQITKQFLLPLRRNSKFDTVGIAIIHETGRYTFRRFIQTIRGRKRLRETIVEVGAQGSQFVRRHRVEFGMRISSSSRGVAARFVIELRRSRHPFSPIVASRRCGVRRIRIRLIVIGGGDPSLQGGPRVHPFRLDLPQSLKRRRSQYRRQRLLDRQFGTHAVRRRRTRFRFGRF